MTEHYNRVIAPTEKTEKALLRFGVKKPIDIIPTGIDTQRFRPENIDCDKLAEIKKELGIENCFTLCYVGRLAPEKNVSLILDNLKRASDEVGGLKFVITGYGPSEDDLKTQVKELGIESIVVFAGKQKPEEIQYYFALGDAFVTASTSETQGLTYIEAMGAGVPVIAKFDECLSNVLIQDVTGFEFTDGDSFVKEVVAFKNLSLEKKSELRNNVLAKAEEYSLENFGANIVRSYTSAIRDKRAENKIY
jgi:1,2-diacylglycerol 3-alpha-glucosyltransferase